MKFRPILLSVVSLALAAGAGWYIYRSLYDSGSSTTADAPSSPPSAVQTVNGETVVVVSPEAQRAGHIEVAPLAAITSQSGISAYATVIDLQPLFDLRSRLASARADVETFSAQAANSRTQSSEVTSSGTDTTMPPSRRSCRAAFSPASGRRAPSKTVTPSAAS